VRNALFATVAWARAPYPPQRFAGRLHSVHWVSYAYTLVNVLFGEQYVHTHPTHLVQ
jgi:hypothetical protein